MVDLMTLIHIVAGSLALLGGAVYLFYKKLFLEKFYVSTSLAASISGFFLIQGIEEGFVAQLGFSTLFLIWLFTLLMFILDSTGTRKWFIRSFALALTFVSLRIWSPFFHGILGAERDLAYAGAIWFAWIVNLLIAEWVFIDR